MKIKTKHISFSDFQKIKTPKHRRPQKPWWILGLVIRIISIPELLATRFSVKRVNMEKAGRGPWLILMNHSSFIDLKIAFRVFFPKRFCIVCTTDALIGKSFLMRKLGCISTNKFVTDIPLISDIIHAIKKLRTSVLMYPEAGYSFDGCATAIPQKLGVLVKKLGVPVVFVKTDGAFLRDPLYNGLQKRKVRVSATVSCLLSEEEAKQKSPEEISAILTEAFTFDAFLEQQKSGTAIRESFRADGLHRILYKCPHCHAENTMYGKGTTITCQSCKKVWELDVYGAMRALSGETEFSHIPDWYAWERACVRDEILGGEYSLNAAVDIGVIADHKSLYMIGSGTLSHTTDGFTLIGCNGFLQYTHPPTASYSLNSDYFWYEIGDVICIGDRKCLYYCFPRDDTNVTKARLATEEIYKLQTEKSKITLRP